MKGETPIHETDFVPFLPRRRSRLANLHATNAVAITFNGSSSHQALPHTSSLRYLRHQAFHDPEAILRRDIGRPCASNPMVGTDSPPPGRESHSRLRISHERSLQPEEPRRHLPTPIPHAIINHSLRFVGSKRRIPSLTPPPDQIALDAGPERLRSRRSRRALRPATIDLGSIYDKIRHKRPDKASSFFNLTHGGPQRIE